MLLKMLLSSLIIFLLPVMSSAEYQAYQYYVKSKYNLTQKSKSYLVTSTMDPVSYISYHGGSESISVDLLRTWMCMGDTSRKDICEGPLSKVKGF